MTPRIIIPARYHSTRLLGKPLALIHGKPMLVHVYEQAKKTGLSDIIIATDDQRIEKTMRAVGATVCMTASTHESGTARIGEVVDVLGYDDDDIIINVQGDEPLIAPENILQVAENLANNKDCAMATLCERITHAADISNPNVVKVVCDAQHKALYFSRLAIPYAANASDGKGALSPDYFRHIGLYAYRAGWIKRYVQLTPSVLEQREKLEQLRALYHGDAIHVAPAKIKSGPGVDTAEDLAMVIAHLNKETK